MHHCETTSTSLKKMFSGLKTIPYWTLESTTRLAPKISKEEFTNINNLSYNLRTILCGPHMTKMSQCTVRLLRVTQVTPPDRFLSQRKISYPWMWISWSRIDESGSIEWSLFSFISSMSSNLSAINSHITVNNAHDLFTHCIHMDMFLFWSLNWNM